jgi:hypothetical protein
MNGPGFKITGKTLFFTGKRHSEVFTGNNGFPTAITTTTGTYGQKWWRIYRWISGIHAVPVQEDSPDRRCCNNCLRNNNCTDGENRSPRTVQECWSNNYSHWEPRYLCGDTHSLEHNNCEDLMGDGWCAHISTPNCHSIADLLKKNWVIKKELKDDDRVKQIKDMFS